MDFLVRALEEILGFTLPALGALMLVLAVRRMAAHAVLIHGTVADLSDTACPSPTTLPWMFQFYLQNLEEVSFPGPFEVVIRGTLTDAQISRVLANEDKRNLEVDVYAGPKSVLLIPDNPDDASRRYVYWRAEFLDLPPYDTWKFQCTSSCPTVEFFVRSKDSDGGVLRPRLAIEMKPSFLRLSCHGRRKDYEGITATPPYSIFAFVLAAALLIYLSASIVVRKEWLSVTAQWSAWQPFDWWALAALPILVWVGFVLIRRQVHPIIQGYLTRTEIGGDRRRAGAAAINAPEQAARRD